MTESNPERITVRCDCGARLKVKAIAVGRKVKCPKCEQVFVVANPEPQPEPEPIAVAPPEDDPFSDGLLDQLASQEAAAQSTTDPNARPDVATPCPSCGLARAAGAVVCMACGYNSATGKKSKAVSAKKAAVAGAASKLARGAGTFLLGCALSFVGALVGAVVWFLVVIATDFQSGWIALGLGALAGFGMSLGYREKNVRAGVTASLISITGIIAAKIMIFIFIVYAIISGDTSNIDLQREYVKLSITEEILTENGAWTEEQREAQWDAAYRKADARVRKMSDKRARKRWQELRDEEERHAAYGTESGSKRIQLARHAANLRAEDRGLSYSDPTREKLYAEEFNRLKEHDDAKLDTGLAELEEWNKEGRWGDEAYVRNHLIYQRIDQAIEKKGDESEDGYWEPSRGEWKTLVSTAKEAVDALSAEQRLEQSRGIESDDQREMEMQGLVYHRLDVQAMRRGLAYSDERRSDLRKEIEAECKALTDEELKAANRQLEAWEAGAKWDDADYVRDHLIYQQVQEVVAERREGKEPNQEGYWQATPKEWPGLYDKAVAAIDKIPADQRARQARSEEQADKERFERELEEAEPYEDPGMASTDAGETLGFFIETMFMPFDLICALFAIVGAFRIASGASSGE